MKTDQAQGSTPPPDPQPGGPAGGASAWDERQLRMLSAMGLRLWSAPPAGANGPRPLQALHPPRPPLPVPDAVPATAGAVVSTADAAMPRAAALPPHATPAPAPAPVEVPVSNLGWEALELAVQACRACDLCRSRRQAVFGIGHRQAAWMIVGEAPGAEEDARGEPFVGPSGQLLDAMLAALGLSRETTGDPGQRVYIANTLKCRPPSNRNPQPAELQRCQPFLRRQVELLQPRLVVAMGRFAAQAMLGSTEPMGQLRGRIHKGPTGPVVVTYHPSYLLRSPAEKAKAWFDLCLAASAMDGSP